MYKSQRPWGKWGFLPLIGFSAFIILNITGHMQGAYAWEGQEVRYYAEPKQIETIYHQNGEVEQFAYRYNGERINIGDVYKITLHEETMYREYVIDSSWLFWNFENFIVDLNRNKIFEFSADGTFDN